MFRSARTLIEKPDAIILRRRPNLPGQIAHPGKLDLLSSYVSKGGKFSTAALRSLQERIPRRTAYTFEPFGEYLHDDENELGVSLRRHIGLFRACVDEACVLQNSPELEEVPLDRSSVEPLAADLTPFTFYALRRIVHLSKG